MKLWSRREKYTGTSRPLEGTSTACVRFHRCGCATEYGPDRRRKRPIVHPLRRSGLLLKFQRGMAETDATSYRSEPVRHAPSYREQKSAFRRGSVVETNKAAVHL